MYYLSMHCTKLSLHVLTVILADVTVSSYGIPCARFRGCADDGCKNGWNIYTYVKDNESESPSDEEQEAME